MVYTSGSGINLMEMENPEDYQNQSRARKSLTTRVHFNPVVSQLRYRQHSYSYPSDSDSIETEFIKNMKNGFQNAENNVVPLDISNFPEKVEKVRVSIASRENPHRIYTNHMHSDNNDVSADNIIWRRKGDFCKNVPDLLTSTDSHFRERHSEKALREATTPQQTSAEANIINRDNSNPKLLKDNRDQLSVLNQKSSGINNIEDKDKFSWPFPNSPNSPSKSSSAAVGNGSGSRLNAWKSGFVQQLSFLKKFVAKERDKDMSDNLCGEKKKRKRKSKIPSSSSSRHTTDRFVNVAEDNFKSVTDELSTVFGVESGAPTTKPRTVDVNSSDLSSSNHRTDHLLGRLDSGTVPFNYTETLQKKPELDAGQHQSARRRKWCPIRGNYDSAYVQEVTDELSANVEKILEEISGLEDIMDDSVTQRVPTLEYNDDEDKITDFAKEFCTVSSALACLTASANSLSSSTSPELVGNIGKPPLPPICKMRFLNTALRKKFFRNPKEDSQNRLTPLKAEHKLATQLDNKLSEFREELLRSREKVSRFHPNFEEIDNSVRSSMAIDRFGRTPPNRTTSSGWESSTSSLYSENSTDDQNSRYAGENILKEWNSILQESKEKLVVSASSFNNEGVLSPTKYHQGILETDLDTGTSREVFRRSSFQLQTDCSSISPKVVKSPKKPKTCTSNLVQRSTCSMQNLNLDDSSSTLSPSNPNSKEDRSRSMEFLLDDEKAKLMPPENTLKKNQERKVSEHELRIQRSLQRLNVPDWYKNYATPGCSGSKVPERDFGSGAGLAGGWSGLSSSKTSSLTSLQSAGRYAGSRTGFSSRPKGTGPVSTGGRSSRESLMSPSSTASASPSPYYERSSFTYGMPYALSRFANARMSCGASPASLSPSPSPVGGITSSTSTPVSSGPMSRYGYNKTPYLGWRSQERLNSKTLYRTPSERLAADLLAQKQKVAPPPSSSVSTGSDISIVTSPRKETASDLSLNTSDDSNISNKLNRVRCSIKEVSNAIVDYVNETKPLDDGINGRASPRRGLIWLESSFVGTKPIDSPGTPDTPSVIMSKHLSAQGSAYLNSKRSSMKLEHNGDNKKDSANAGKSTDNSQAFSSYLSRNEKMGERSNSSSVSSPTLEDILDSLLALRRPHKKIRGKGHKDPPEEKEDSVAASVVASKAVDPFETPISDWQERMNQPLDDTAYFPPDTDSFVLSTTTTGSNNEDIYERSRYSSAFDEDRGKSGRSENDEQEGATRSRSPWLDLDAQEDNEDMHGRIAQEESLFGTPTEIHTTIPSIINNPLAGLNESSNPPTPRHRRVSFDLDVSDKEEKSSSRSKRDESVGGSIQCKNAKCGKTATGLEARREFKTCHNCNAYYCSRDCRRIHWEKHKKVCMQSRVGQLCKQIIGHVKEDSFVVSQLSTVAKRGYLAKGRGCVKLFFSSPDRAERFLTGGLPELPEPWYIPHSDMLPEEMGAPTFSELSESCRTYNTETRYVLYVSVCVVNEVPTSGAVKWEREMISRSSKIRLLLPRSFDENQPHHHAAIPAHLNPEDVDPPAYSPTHSAPGFIDDDSLPSLDNETLILRSVPTSALLKLNSHDDRRRREVSFANIQKHLIERGVDLRRTYPDIYSKLCNYVENDEPFMPVTIYPRNSQTGSQFMCVIMPESSDTSYGFSEDPSRKVETINISE